MLRDALIRAHPERDGDFRWRGDGVSRIEGLSDAVFGFAVTLLVVSLEVPRTFDELLVLLLGFPAFAGSFALLVLVWAARYRFFRRYGLEDGRTIVLNVALLFFVVFFIYPLKFVFSTFLALWIGALGAALDVPALAAQARTGQAAIRQAQWPVVMGVFAAGYVAIYALFALLHRHALAQSAALGLDARERHATRAAIGEHWTHVAVAVLSLGLTLMIAYGPWAVPYPPGFSRPGFGAMLGGFAYTLEGPLQFLTARRFARAAPVLPPDTGVAGTDGVATADAAAAPAASGAPWHATPRPPVAS